MITEILACVQTTPISLLHAQKGRLRNPRGEIRRPFYLRVKQGIGVVCTQDTEIHVCGVFNGALNRETLL